MKPSEAKKWLLNEQPRSKLRGIEHPSLNSFRGKPRGIEPEEIKFRSRCYIILMLVGMYAISLCAKQSIDFWPLAMAEPLEPVRQPSQRICIGLLNTITDWRLTSNTAFDEGPNARYYWLGRDSQGSDRHASVKPYGCIVDGIYRSLNLGKRVTLDSDNHYPCGGGTVAKGMACLAGLGDAVFPDLAPVRTIRWFQNGVERQTLSAAVRRGIYSEDQIREAPWKYIELITKPFWLPSDLEKLDNVRSFRLRGYESLRGYTLSDEIVTSARNTEVSWFAPIAAQKNVMSLPIVKLAQEVQHYANIELARYRTERLPRVDAIERPFYEQLASRLESRVEAIGKASALEIVGKGRLGPIDVMSPRLGRLRDQLFFISIRGEEDVLHNRKPMLFRYSAFFWWDGHKFKPLRSGLGLAYDRISDTEPIGVLSTVSDSYLLYYHSGVRYTQTKLHQAKSSPYQSVIDRIVVQPEGVHFESLGSLEPN